MGLFEAAEVVGHLARILYLDVNIVDAEDNSIASCSMAQAPRVGEYVHVHRKVTDEEPLQEGEESSLVGRERYKGRFVVLSVEWRCHDNLAIGTENATSDRTCWVHVEPSPEEPL